MVGLSMKDKKAIIVILAVVFLAYGYSLFNGFSGDDNFLIVRNSFYKSWQNFPRLFSHTFISRSDEIISSLKDDTASGHVSYTPVVSVTYFFDYWLWKMNAFGYHLHSLILHALNAIILYFIVICIWANVELALLSALIFAAHPINIEAVCSMGHRADVLACLFLLSSFLYYIRFQDKKEGGSKSKIILSHFFYFLAVFTKESAIVYPAILFFCDYLINKDSMKTGLVCLTKRYGGFVFIAIFYLYIYMFIFPNTSLHDKSFFGGKFITHVLFMAGIFVFYLRSFLNPLDVGIIPPLYAPFKETIGGVNLWIALAAILIFLLVMIVSWRSNKRLAFFIIWFLLCFIPVSNIIPLVNPFSYRFMYLPGVGLSVLAAFLINQLLRNFSPSFVIIRRAVIGFLIVLTIALSAYWKSDYTRIFHMVKDFPDSPSANFLMSAQLFDFKKYNESAIFLFHALELGIEDPRANQMMGMFHIKHLEKSKNYFEKNIKLFPLYGPSYIGMGRYYFLEKDYDRAANYLRKSLEFGPSFAAYAYLMQIDILKGNRHEAENILSEAQKRIKSPNEIHDLSNFLNAEYKNKIPMDIWL